MKINKVVVIGSGTMGSGIAAQLCNANVPVTLLDLTTEISEKVKDKKLKDYFLTVLIEKMWKMQYFRDHRFLSKDCLRFALLSSNFFLIDHLLYREAARGK